MTTLHQQLGAIVLLLTVISWPGGLPADDQQSDAEVKSPSAVVARWLELHRSGKRDEAAALTSGSPDHRARLLLPFKRDTGVRVARSLGNQRAAAVVTGSLGDARDGERVMLFWLVQRDGKWLINQSDSFEKRVVDERLRGFFEAGDVQWHVQRDQLLGLWEAGPCYLPGVKGILCGGRLQLGEDNRYRLESWGPGGPDPEFDDALQGKWQIANGQIILSHQDRSYECPVTWIDDNQLEIKSADGKVAVFELANETQAETPTEGTKHSFKGWELYVWPQGDATSYSLMVGTNRIKTDAEIVESAVKRFEAIKAKLDELKNGESVFICGRRRFDVAPAASAQKVAEYCETIGLKVQ